MGHTKFSPDWCFGLLKQKFWKTSVNCLKDIEDVVDGSAVVNTSQLVGDQFGKVIVPTYDWADYLGVHFNKVPSINSLRAMSQFIGIARGRWNARSQFIAN